MASFGQVTFVGVSTETKPTTMPGGADLPAGCQFVETDTERSYYWTGTAWTLLDLDVANDIAAAAQLAVQLETNGLLRDLLAEMTAVRTAAQETYNEGRPPAEQVDFREAALAYLDRPDSEDT